MAATGKKVQTGQTKKKSTSAAGQKRTASQGKRKTTAGKSTARAKTSKRSNSKKKQDKIEAYVWKDIGLIICLVSSVLLFVSCFERFGPYLSWLKQINFGIFGYIGYITPFILAGLSLYFIVSAKKVHPQLKILGWILSLCGLCGLSRLWFQVENGGGWIGQKLYEGLFSHLGAVGMYLTMVGAVLIGLVLVTEWSIMGFFGKGSRRAIEAVKGSAKLHKETYEVKAEERALRREQALQEKRMLRQQELERIREEREKMLKNRLSPVSGIGDTTLAPDDANTPAPDREEEKKETKKSGKEPRTSGVQEIKISGLFGEDNRDDNTEEKNPNKNTLGEEEEQWVNTFTGEIYFGDTPLEKEAGKLEEDFVRPGKDSRTNEEIEAMDQNYHVKEEKSIVMEEAFFQELKENLETINEEEERKADLAEKALEPELSLEDSKEELPWDEKEPESPLEENPAEYKTVTTASGKVITVELDGVPGERKRPKPEPKKEPEEETAVVINDTYVEPKEYEYPSLKLLKKGQNASQRGAEQELRKTAAKLQQILQNFGVGVTVTNISCGPAVTRYELQPEQGVKVSKIVSLTDDIKLNLAAADIRMEAPIPGKAAIGIEVPNKENQTVMLRDLLETDEFKKHKSKIAFAVGKDIGGQTVVADIAKMPHLLIAGATGSGKSVCINTLIMSILYKAKPSEVKLIMIDPKVVELSVYNGIPHLLIPVVTDPKKAAGALNWAVAEMMQRYQKFADMNVRDINGYNRKVESVQDAADEETPKPMPRIVIIVDELADLMMVAPGDVEDAICRLAQLARAAGIHLVIATQRPSVNVITGLIKANVPSRIAFSVSSGVDSRTIIDMNGAEKLLGKGDMLFYPAGYQKPARVQGAFVSDSEVSAVVEFLSGQTNVIGGGQDHTIDLASSASALGGRGGSAERDDYFRDAAKFIIEKDKASIGMLQRVFKIGFNRAARIMDQLAQAGVVGEEEGTKPRKVLMSMEEFEQFAEENL
ncbi:MAG TPA: DNA translocase FtsK 4TM domain-containing protein [Candidatus Fimimorpha excrementavium]|nr:DNA translocase FtsK 4TM domain-containing protein [Candidatus Fimimorpha excrementavium]